MQAIGVTNRPGLLGALSVGVSAAKALALALEVPLVGVHHLEGHLMSAYVGADPPDGHLSLIVSGGHTEVVRVMRPGQYEILAQTIDDAAGEAFDKSARLLGLGYPGGYQIEVEARSGDPGRYPLPRALDKDPTRFSFSGLKTAVLRLTEHEGDRIRVADAAASVQEAIVDVLNRKALALAEHFDAPALSLVGGVAANSSLREQLARECERAGIAFFVPPRELCTDNAAMIGLAASFRLASGQRDGFDMDVFPTADLA